jgi:hypothetical protein
MRHTRRTEDEANPIPKKMNAATMNKFSVDSFQFSAQTTLLSEN